MKASISLFWFGALAMLICGALYLASFDGRIDSGIYQHVFSGIVNYKAAIAMVVLGAFFVLGGPTVSISNKAVKGSRW